jgi:hypothetical protein
MGTDNLADWIAIFISIAALGWTIRETLATRKELKAQEARAERRTAQQEYRSLLDNFLLPMTTNLARSRRDFESLKHGQLSEVHHLEYYPDRLRALFESLPDDRRIFWRVEIGGLHEHNDQLIQLIDAYGSRSLFTSEFQQGCEAFRRHATTWKAMWNAVSDLSIPRQHLPSQAIADPFPNGFDDIVKTETARFQQYVA